MPAWERRAIPDEGAAGRADQSRRAAGLSARQRARRPSRPRPGRIDVAGQRRANHHDLLDRRPDHPRHGLHQLHQSRHRARQPARARGRAAQGDGREPPAAHRPVHRRIDDPRHRLDAGGAGAGRAAAALAGALPRCRPRHPLSGRRRHPAAGAPPGAAGRRGRRSLSRLCTCPGSGPPRCSRRTSRPPSRAGRGGCATRWSSASSPPRSRSSSALRGLCPDPVRAPGRSRLRPQRADPGVEPRRRPDRQRARGAGRAGAADPGRHRGGAHRHRHQHAEHDHHRRHRARPRRAGGDQLLRGRRRLLRHDAGGPRRRPHLRRRPRRPTKRRSIPTGPRRASGQSSAAASTSSSTSSPPGGSASPIPARRSGASCGRRSTIPTPTV